MIRFRLKTLDRSFQVCPGDRFNLTYTETGTNEYGDLVYNETLLHSEPIHKTRVISCFAVLDLPVGLGLFLGESLEALREFISQTWPDSRECNPDEKLL